MFSSFALIDSISSDGILTSCFVTPTATVGNQILFDELSDIDVLFQSEKSRDLGGIRIYNYSDCSIHVVKTRIRNYRWSDVDKSIIFSFDHKNIPWSNAAGFRVGRYNLVLPPSLRLIEFSLDGPLQETQTGRKMIIPQFKWDTTSNCQLVEAEILTSENFVSLRIEGYAAIDSNDKVFIASQILRYSVADIDLGEKDPTRSIVEKSRWLELKPNFMGIGININAIIEDALKYFKRS